jgi:hypothetical protein
MIIELPATPGHEIARNGNILDFVVGGFVERLAPERQAYAKGHDQY